MLLRKAGLQRRMQTTDTFKSSERRTFNCSLICSCVDMLQRHPRQERLNCRTMPCYTTAIVFYAHMHGTRTRHTGKVVLVIAASVPIKVLQATSKQRRMGHMCHASAAAADLLAGKSIVISLSLSLRNLRRRQIHAIHVGSARSSHIASFGTLRQSSCWPNAHV